ncbi:Dynein regulatory complex subunit 7 [Dissostichus eleginoides]|uniref:Dynein regulatory complex subunit 7 n=1 Tax=Dissostichus eleginoides TaxID=100907 RepID=A0AAD9C9M0_DISEL|nr:Dynein regulatory complex subunit 7 [Dissostichus eleginoides]KAK1898512.1 Dynein regulatory complex subunit 7 [Dissostichus eleginoides]
MCWWVKHVMYSLSFISLKVDELCPESYRVNSPDQIRLLAIADNFQRQYSLLYPDRKPLLLCPVNECGVRVKLKRLNPLKALCPHSSFFCAVLF